MNGSVAELTQVLERLRLLSASDFAAWAPGAARERPVQWAAGCGSLNGRYRRMTVKPGFGLAGTALRVGRSVRRSGGEAAGGEAPCPLWQAERLEAGAALPLTEGGVVKGVLLLGRRNPRAYTDLELAEAVAELAFHAALLQASVPL